MSHHTFTVSQSEAAALGRQGIKSHHSFCHTGAESHWDLN